jgi:hypothetical protein
MKHTHFAIVANHSTTTESFHSRRALALSKGGRREVFPTDEIPHLWYHQTKGANFPITHAKRGLALVRAVVARGEGWQRNGHTFHLGHYQIESGGIVR